MGRCPPLQDGLILLCIRIERNIINLDLRNEQHVRSTVNSYLGVLSHSASYNLRRDVFCVEPFLKHGYFADDMTCYYLRQ